MTAVFTGPTEILIAALFPSRYDKHVQDWRWHLQAMNLNPDYLEAIAARQAAKRTAGIGPEGMCRA